MERKPLDPAEGVRILTERLAYRHVNLRYHRESWFGTAVGKIAYWLFGAKFPTTGGEHDWVIVQTIGNTIWVPANWDTLEDRIKFELLMHEEVHTLQFEKYGLGNMTFGVVTMGFLYLLVLPTVWTCRAMFEREAYYASIRALWLMGKQPGPGFVKHLVENFTTRRYVWMQLPRKSVERWAVRAINKAKLEPPIP
jgi:hypothetical protein